MEFLTVTKAKEDGIIPELWHSCIPDTCSYCGQALMINRPCTVMKCSGISCCRKLAYQITAFLQDLGYKGIGPETLTTYCKYCGIKTILDYIKLPNVCDLVDTLNNLELSYANLISLLHVPNLGTKAYKLFKGYSNYAEFDKAMADSGNAFNFLLNIIGGYDTTVETAHILIDYLPVFTGITSLVKVVSAKTQVIEIAITGRITQVTSADGKNFTKDEFIQSINRLARKYALEFRLSNALESVPLIIADTPSNTRKYLIGLRRKVLYSSKDLLHMIINYGARKENANGAGA